MRKLISILKIISFVAALIICLGLAIYAINYPELTYPQLFLKWWWLYVIAMALAFVGVNEIVS